MKAYIASSHLSITKEPLFETTLDLGKSWEEHHRERTRYILETMLGLIWDDHFVKVLFLDELRPKEDE